LFQVFEHETTYWSQANLTNFINVTAGALGIMLPTAWQLDPKPNVTVESVMDMPRLDRQRSFVLLAAPLISLASVGMLALLSVLMYRDAGLMETKLGTTGEIVMNTQTTEIRSAVEDIKAGVRRKSALEHMRLRYGRVADGFEGLSPSASTNAPFSIRKEN
jgi:hypothetical protein